MPYVDPTHQHFVESILDPDTDQPINPGGATPTLAEVLVAGNDPGGVAIKPQDSQSGSDYVGAASVGIATPVATDLAQGFLTLSGPNYDDNGTDGWFSPTIVLNFPNVIATAGVGYGANYGGSVQLTGAASASYSGASVTIEGGREDLSRDGHVIMTGLVFLNLPTSDPGVSGALWNDAGTVKVSP